MNYSIKLLSFSLFFFSVCVNAQEMNNSSLFNVSLRSGISTYEVENQFKSVAVNYSAHLLKEFKISDQGALNLGLGVNNFHFDFVDSNGLFINAQNTFLELPIGYKRYTYNENRTNAFVTELGILNRLKLNEDFTTFPETDFKEDLGYHLAYMVGLGYQTTINDKIGFAVGFIYSSDLLDSGYDNSNRIENQVSIYFDFKFFN